MPRPTNIAITSNKATKIIRLQLNKYLLDLKQGLGIQDKLEHYTNSNMFSRCVMVHNICRHIQDVTQL